MSPTLRSFLIGQLRRLSYKWPAYTQVWHKAKCPSCGYYRCAKCGPAECKGACHRRKDCERDHITPVIPTSGWDGLEQFCMRLFCAVTGLQILCKPCHYEKTQAENRVRRGK